MVYCGHVHVHAYRDCYGQSITIDINLLACNHPNVSVQPTLRLCMYMYSGMYNVMYILVPLHSTRRLLYILLVRKVIMRQCNCYWRREQIPMYKIW